MVPTLFIFRMLRRRPAVHPDAVGDAPLSLPRRIDSPASAAHVAADLLRHRREDITLALFLDGRHRLVGTAIVAVGWAQAARLSARPILQGSQACRAESAVVVRYGRWRVLSATEAEDRSFRSLVVACIGQGLPLLDHVVVSERGRFASARFQRRA